MTVHTIIKICFRRILILYAVLIIASVQISRSTANTIDNGTVCQTPLCKEIAEMIINTVNQSVNPCENFYEYACGNINVNNQINNSTSTNFLKLLQNRTHYRLKEIVESKLLPSENIALKKSKQLYQACMDTKAIEKEGLNGLLQLIDGLGGWPMTMTQKEWKYRERSWQQIDLKIRKTLGHSPLFVLAVAPDQNSSTYIQLLSLPKLPSETHSFLSDDDITAAVNQTANQRYRKIILDSAKVIAKYQKTFIPNIQLEIDATNVLKFELELRIIAASAQLNASKLIHGYHEPITIDELQKKCDAVFPKTSNGKVNWHNYIRHLYFNIPNVYVTGSQKILVVSEQYFTDLIGLLDRTPSRVIVNAMHWWVVKELAVTLKSELRNLIYDKKIEESRLRWKYCLSRNELHHAISQTYMQKYPLTSKAYVSDMVKEIIESMRNDINKSSWLDDDSKLGALKKLSLMKDFIGYPDWYENHEALSSTYANVPLYASFYHNTLALSAFHFQQSLGLLGQPANKNSWAGKPTDVNAFYNYRGNSLTLPGGILQFPVFDIGQPDVINYGAIGFIIGHEISHGFDYHGRLYDEIGNLRDWWSNATKFEYGKKAQCFINRFSKYGITFNKTFYRLNAVKTLSENIADTTGINALFKAFTIHSMKHPTQANIKLPGLEHLSNEQLLFIIWSHTVCERRKFGDMVTQMQVDNHSPAPFRIVGTLSNINSFSDAYQCAKGTAMNPVNKCSIW